LERKNYRILCGKPKLQKLVYHLFYTRPKWYKAYHTLSISRYLNLAILMVFATGLGFGIYQQFFAKTPSPIAYPTQPTPPQRYLSFQGRLTNQFNTPITVPTTMVSNFMTMLPPAPPFGIRPAFPALLIPMKTAFFHFSWARLPAKVTPAPVFPPLMKMFFQKTRSLAGNSSQH